MCFVKYFFEHKPAQQWQDSDTVNVLFFCLKILHFPEKDDILLGGGALAIYDASGGRN